MQPAEVSAVLQAVAMTTWATLPKNAPAEQHKDNPKAFLGTRTTPPSPPHPPSPIPTHTTTTPPSSLSPGPGAQHSTANTAAGFGLKENGWKGLERAGPSYMK
ncbi:hypothetical protein EYF80_028191 [Liparis tanakae]|uniref:Uncharacterized protein n=1 Tax=Liparis tanakae TaxID=230148 RepID=A0A4Z2H706_9TELE|nr:hypothetical protein EYF80_028191 [Liparis tanakae]